jgi:hypothetical protein
MLGINSGSENSGGVSSASSAPLGFSRLNNRRNSSFQDTRSEQSFLIRYSILVKWAQDLLKKVENGESKALTKVRFTDFEMSTKRNDIMGENANKWRRKSMQRQISELIPGSPTKRGIGGSTDKCSIM